MQKATVGETETVKKAAVSKTASARSSSPEIPAHAIAANFGERGGCGWMIMMMMVSRGRLTTTQGLAITGFDDACTTAAAFAGFFVCTRVPGAMERAFSD